MLLQILTLYDHIWRECSAVQSAQIFNKEKSIR